MDICQLFIEEILVLEGKELKLVNVVMKYYK